MVWCGTVCMVCVCNCYAWTVLIILCTSLLMAYEVKLVHFVAERCSVPCYTMITVVECKTLCTRMSTPIQTRSYSYLRAKYTHRHAYSGNS